MTRAASGDSRAMARNSGLFPVHLRNESPEGAGLLVREGAELPAETRLADGADLVHCDLSAPAAYPAAEPGAPGGMELGRERTDGDGLEMLVQRVEAHDHGRPSLGHLGALDGIEGNPPDFVA